MLESYNWPWLQLIKVAGNMATALYQEDITYLHGSYRTRAW
jgi:hypothetical protein